MQRTVMKFSGNRLSGYAVEEDRGDIPYGCSDGEGFYVKCGRCGKWMDFSSSQLVFRCSCGTEVDDERVQNYAFGKFRSDLHHGD